MPYGGSPKTACPSGHLPRAGCVGERLALTRSGEWLGGETEFINYALIEGVAAKDT
jgi:hypothetical protein